VNRAALNRVGLAGRPGVEQEGRRSPARSPDSPGSAEPSRPTGSSGPAETAGSPTDPDTAAAATGGLPFVDEHHVLVAAHAPTVWRCLGRQLAGPRFAAPGALVYLVGTQPRRASGAPLAEGSTLPGFVVAEAVPEHRARLTGRHHFSRYALTLTLVTEPAGTLLTAYTHAEFPGPLGQVYRGLVIGSGAHRVLVPRLLRAVRHQAEHQSCELAIYLVLAQVS